MIILMYSFHWEQNGCIMTSGLLSFSSSLFDKMESLRSLWAVKRSCSLYTLSVHVSVSKQDAKEELRLYLNVFPHMVLCNAHKHTVHGWTYGPNTVPLIWHSWFWLLQMWCEGVCETQWGAKRLMPHRWRVDGRGCGRLGDRWRWVHAAGRGCLSSAAPALGRTHKPSDAHTQSRLSHKDDALRDLSLCTPQAWNGMFPWREERNYNFKRGEGYFGLG